MSKKVKYLPGIGLVRTAEESKILPDCGEKQSCYVCEKAAECKQKKVESEADEFKKKYPEIAEKEISKLKTYKQMENKTVNTDFSVRENKALSLLQNFRYELLQWCGTTEDAVKAYQFVVDGNTIGCKESKPQLEPQQIRDGIYLIDQSGFVIPYDPDNEPGRSSIEPYTIIGVGVKWGEHTIVVALKDEMDGAEIALATKDTEEDSPAYCIKNVRDAVADWNHEANTEHLRKVLNPQIKLKDGWYIPAMGEMLFIFLNLKAINAALRYVGGQEIQENWYWTSTEYSSTKAWYLYLRDGYMNSYAKASGTIHVRAVSAFNF